VPKKLTTQAKMQRLHNQGFSDSQIANVTGFSKSSVGRIRRGQQSGEKITPAVNEFFKLGKRSRQNVASGAISLPSAKPARATKGKARVAVENALISPLRRAEGQAAALPKDSQVVVQVTIKGTGKSRTLYAHGGVWIGEIKNDLRGAITSQYGRQYDGGFDWDDVIDIDVQEY
jgi:hypothetical protein